ncbi:MAG: acyl carrier protein [Chromatiales bacterium]|nr:acyl carrier protein [Chromatiales bacterium]
MNCSETVVRILTDTLQVPVPPEPDFALLGALPEFDSMAVVAVLTAIEDTFGFAVEDDAISADDFASVGSLCSFVEGQLKTVT